jgi:hypothetical protein
MMNEVHNRVTNPTPSTDAGHRADAASNGTEPTFLSTELAAHKLGMDADSLRARCRRAAKGVGDAAVAQLGGGIVAFKFGRRWRLRFPHAY